MTAEATVPKDARDEETVSSHPSRPSPRTSRAGTTTSSCKRRAGRLHARARLHGHSAVRLRDLGVDARRARSPHQADRPRERLLPAVRAAQPAREGSRARRGLQSAGRVGHPRRWRGAERVAGHPADQRGDHRREGQGLGPVISRPAAALQPVEQRRPLGAAHAPLPAHRRVPVAGGAHLSRHRAGGGRRGRGRPRGYRAASEEWLAIPVIRGAQDRQRDVPGRRLQRTRSRR